MTTAEDLVTKVRAYYSGADAALIRRAFDFSKKVHKGQKRQSGDPYFVHPVGVASLIADLKLDVPSVVTGLLHDTREIFAYQLDQRDQRGNQRREQRCTDRDDEHVGIERKLEPVISSLEAEHAHELDAAIREQQPPAGAREREQQTLEQEQPRKPAQAGAQCRAHCELLTALGEPREL
jgi:hypothetical protein